MAGNLKLLEVLEAVERLFAPPNVDELAAAISSGLVGTRESDEGQKCYFLSENGTVYLQSLRRERARQTCMGVIAPSGGDEKTTREQIRALAEVVLGLLEFTPEADPQAGEKAARMAEIARRVAEQEPVAS